MADLPGLAPPGKVFSQALIWTALPQGYVTRPSTASSPGRTTLLLTAFVSVQLTYTDSAGVRDKTSTTLSTFADWANWPQTMLNSPITFTAHINGGPALPATVDTSQLHPEYWGAVFDPSTTRVDSYVASDFANTTQKTFNASSVAQSLAAAYSYATPGQVELDKNLTPVQTGSKPSPVDTSYTMTKTAVHSVQSALTFRAPVAFSENDLPFAPTPPVLDFHTVVASLSSYPELLRYFGLAFPIQVTVATSDLNASFDISLTPSWTPSSATPKPATTNTSPVTKCQFGNGLFIPASKGADYGDGFLNIDRNQFTCYDFDFDSASQDLTAYLQKLQSAVGPEVTAKSIQVLLNPPQLRSTGLQIVWENWGSNTGTYDSSSSNPTFNLKSLAERQASLAAEVAQGKVPTLYAEDLTHGWRLDVAVDHDPSENNSGEFGPWQSLHWRQASFVFGSNAEYSIADTEPIEAFVTPGVTHQVNPDGSTDSVAAVHEAVIRWDGWSLAGPRPGLHIDEDGTLVENPGNPMVDSSVKDADGNINAQLSATFTVPQSGMTVNDPVTNEVAGTTGLPSLRFGSAYNIRIRAVDLSGWSIPQSTSTDATFTIQHSRWEAVKPPIVIPTAEFTSGEGDLIIVIRGGGNPKGSTTSSRWLFPPIIHQTMAEELGAFDMSTGNPNPGAYPNFASFVDGTPNSLPGMKDFQTGAGLAYRTLPSGDPAAGVTACWLPDPWAAGIALNGLQQGIAFPSDYFPNKSGEYSDGILLDPWVSPDDTSYPAWPAKLLQLVGTLSTDPTNDNPGTLPAPVLTVTPASNGNAEVISLGIHPASVYVCQLSNFVPNYQLLGIWPLLEDGIFEEYPNLGPFGLKDQAIEQEAYVSYGQYSQISPLHTLRFIYAVLVPLAVPNFTSPTFTRDLNDLTVRIEDDKYVIDQPSTQKLTFTATWTDPVDNPADPNNDPMTDTVSFDQRHLIVDVDTIFPPPVAADPIAAIPDKQPDSIFGSIEASKPILTATHRFGDTKHHRVTYQATATSRFGEFFTETQSVTIDDSDDPVVLDPNGIATNIGSVVYTAGSKTVTVPPSLYTLDGSAGTITINKGASILVDGQKVSLAGATLDVTFAPTDSVTGDAKVIEIHNCAVPPPMKIAKVVPAWQVETLGHAYARVGNILRVSFERPWYVTGADEFVGVVTAKKSSQSNPSPGLLSGDDVASMSLLGFDPISISAHAKKDTYTQTQLSFVTNVDTFSDGSSFTNPTSAKSSFDANGDLYDIWCYAPTFDAASNMWFVDVTLDMNDGIPQSLPPGYFLRLALCRFQPYGLDGALDTSNNKRYPTYASPISLLTFAQPVADRTILVTEPAANTYHVEISGPGYEGYRLALDEGKPLQSAGTGTIQDKDNKYAEHPNSDHKGAKTTSLMVVEVQVSAQGTFTGDFAWKTVSGLRAVLKPNFDKSPMITWESSPDLTVPDLQNPMRLRISEIDYSPYDADSLPGTIDTNQRRPFVAFIDLQ